MGDALRQDVRHAVRHFRRSPAFAAAAIVILAIGIGANAALFTMLNTLLIQRLPIRDPSGLISLTNWNARGVQRSLPLALVDELSPGGPLQQLCGYNGGFTVAVEANAEPTQASAAFVTGGCLETFGVRPILGRTLDLEDAPLSSAGAKVALISYAFWARAFGSDPGVIGKTIRTEGVEMIVIGVLPRGFGGLEIDSAADILAPFDTIFPAPSNRRPVAAEILGRLRPGTSLGQALAEISARWPRLLTATVPATLPPLQAADLFGGNPRLGPIANGLSPYRNRYAHPLTLILCLTASLLLLASANLGGLLLTRLATRTAELSVRFALGGSRWQIARQMVVEGLLLSCCGTLLAVPLSFVFTKVIVSFIPAGVIASTLSFTPDLRVLLVTAGVGFSVGILISALPVWYVVRREAAQGDRTSRTVTGTRRLARGLVVLQVAMSVVILSSAGLLVQSLYRLQRVNLGVRSAGVVTAKLMQVPNGYRDLDHSSYYPALLGKIATLPGVRSVGLAHGFPRVLSDGIGAPIAFVGESQGDVRGYVDVTSPGFFETVGIPLISGRFTTWSDNNNSRQVAIVSASLARSLATDGNVLYRRIRLGSVARDQDVVIVGIVGNATQGNPRLCDLPVIYRPALQLGRAFSAPNLMIAVDGSVGTVATGVRRILREEGHEYAQEIVPLDDIFSRAPSTERMTATVGGVIGALAAAIALIGIYVSLAYSVSRRTREIGVRLAVGAEPRGVAAMIMAEGIGVAFTGVVLGIPLALWTSKGLSALMFGISDADPATFLGVAGFFLLAGAAAATFPAYRGACIDPVVALRAE